MTVELPEGCPACGALPCDWAPGTPSQTVSQDRAVEAELAAALEPFATAARVHKNEPGLGQILIPCTVADLRRATNALVAFKKSEVGHG